MWESAGHGATEVERGATGNSGEGWRQRERKSGAGVRVISLVGWR